MLIFSPGMTNLFLGRSSSEGEYIISVSLLRIFGHPNTLLDWRANSNLIFHTNIRVCPNTLYSNAGFSGQCLSVCAFINVCVSPENLRRNLDLFKELLENLNYVIWKLMFSNFVEASQLKQDILGAQVFLYWSTTGKLKFTDWSQVQRKLSFKEIEIFQQRVLIAPPPLWIISVKNIRNMVIH